MKYVLLAMALVAFAFAACGDDDDDDGGALPSQLAEVCEDNPDPATDEMFQVDEPQPGDSVTSPVTISGLGSVFEAQFSITIFDADGERIVDYPGRTEEGQTLAPFSESVGFGVQAETPACLWVYELSPEDGDPVHVVQVPILLLPPEGTTGGATTSAATTAAATTVPATTSAGSATPTSVLENICLDNPAPGTAETIDVAEPQPADEVTSPLTVSGVIAAFEATFKVTLYDGDGTEIADATAMSSEGQTLAPFETELPFEVSEETPACLWVYEASPRDGEPVNVSQVPVVLLP